MRFSRKQIRTFVCVVVLLVLIGRYAGRLLVVNDAPQHADAIFMLMGVPGERALFCAELYKKGFAPKIILTNTATDKDEQLLLSYGIKPLFDSQYVRQILTSAGVASTDIVTLPGPAKITIDEGRNLADYCALHPEIRSVLVVTSNYHTRRSQWIVSHQLKKVGRDISLVFPANPLSQYNPDQWWRSRSAIGTTAYEYSKIFYYWFWNRWFYP